VAASGRPTTWEGVRPQTKHNTHCQIWVGRRGHEHLIGNVLRGPKWTPCGRFGGVLVLGVSPANRTKTQMICKLRDRTRVARSPAGRCGSLLGGASISPGRPATRCVAGQLLLSRVGGVPSQVQTFSQVPNIIAKKDIYWWGTLLGFFGLWLVMDYVGGGATVFSSSNRYFASFCALTGLNECWQLGVLFCTAPIKPECCCVQLSRA
jgi:hypothetical protein